MSIVVVGGHSRMCSLYEDICQRRGHRAKVYTHMPARFSKAIGQPAGIILFTSTVSHSMVRTAVQEARKKRIPVVRAHSSSAESLENALSLLETAAR